ncbi:MAG: hypothetical protein R3E97_23825 [Candidatus Eisenbacteria bacterium]
MPQPGFQLFRAEKPEGTVRIFVLGGSTTAGFPYTSQGAFANFLRIRLEQRLPGVEFEVVNCGITALNSYAVLDFVKELRQHSPDLFLVYAGHNEFYGALGPASRVAFGKSQPWVRTLRWVMDLRISRLLSQTASKVGGEKETTTGQTLMGAMVGQTGIREGDPIWTATLEGYESNLKGIVDAAGDTPVLFCEVVSNLRDQYPFESLCAEGTPDTDRERFGASAEALARELGTALLRDEVVPSEDGVSDGDDLSPGEAADSTGADARVGGANSAGPRAGSATARTASLVERANTLVSQQPDHAGAVYAHAQASLLGWLIASGDPESPDEPTIAPQTIRAEFARARDLDAIRFRAPSQINETIRAVVRSSGGAVGGSKGGPGAGSIGSTAHVGLVPVADWIDSRSAYGIPGHDMFVEHLHLNLRGADEVARAIVNTLDDSDWLHGRIGTPGPTSRAPGDRAPAAGGGVSEVGTERPEDPSFEFVVQKAGLTSLDHEIAERRAFHLTHRWPYPEDRTATFHSTRPRIVQQTAEAFIDHEIDLAEAHFRLGEAWFKEGRREDALAELVAACEVFPVVPQRFLLAGRLALEDGRQELARSLLERGAALDPSNADLAKWVERSRQAGR